jgi:hypothetical protein
MPFMLDIRSRSVTQLPPETAVRLSRLAEVEGRFPPEMPLAELERE